ncbi:WW domain-binding protein 4 [Nymphon striatum]|nr:WW domain-binding protein 4 [Nymphon striatum]KAG1693199.1 WW domain-binding protein 4 [Nymphon striatum]
MSSLHSKASYSGRPATFYHKSTPPDYLESSKKASSARNSTAFTGLRLRTKYACVGANEHELSFEPNQVIENARLSRYPDWLEGTYCGKTGLFPENYTNYQDVMERLQGEASEKTSNSDRLSCVRNGYYRRLPSDGSTFNHLVNLKQIYVNSQQQLFDDDEEHKCLGRGASKEIFFRDEIRTEYWKSIPRKFCDFCKCWLTDNKPSINFHEKGKKHQENVKRKLSQIAKKGQKDYLQQKKMDKDMAKMEKAALTALKKDIEANPELASQYGAELASLEAKNSSTEGSTKSHLAHISPSVQKPLPYSPAISSTVVKKEKKSGKPVAPPKVWYEAVTDEDHTYYWNVETNESTWEAPKEYISLSEQQAPTDNETKPVQENAQKEESEETSELTKKFEHFKEKISKENEEDEFDSIVSCNAIGPKAKPNPYGKWTVVNTKPLDKVDLQLPKTNIEYTEFIVAKKEPVKFIEKVLDSSALGPSDGTSVGFKRRKNTSFKRNIRRRDDDEETS